MLHAGRHRVWASGRTGSPPPEHQCPRVLAPAASLSSGGRCPRNAVYNECTGRSVRRIPCSVEARDEQEATVYICTLLD